MHSITYLTTTLISLVIIGVACTFPQKTNAQDSRSCVIWEEVKSEVESLYSQFLYSDRLGYSHPLPELPDGFKNGCVFGDSGASTIAISVSKDEVRTRIAQDYDTIFGVIPHYSSIVDVEPETDKNKQYLNFYNICSSVGTASTKFCQDLPTDSVYIKEEGVCLQKLCIKADSTVRTELVRLWNEALEQRQIAASASTNPIIQQVSSTTKNCDTQNKIAQNLNATVKQNETHNQILLEAIENQDLEGVKSALANGADANAINPTAITALMFAAMNGNLDIFNTLLEAGADVNLDSGEGETALMYAAVGGHLEMAQILIAKGADVNVQDGGDVGGTALMQAAAGGHIEIVKLLLANGADTSIKSLYGDTALSLAQQNGYPQIVELLKQAE